MEPSFSSLTLITKNQDLMLILKFKEMFLHCKVFLYFQDQNQLYLVQLILIGRCNRIFFINFWVVQRVFY